MAIDGHVVGFQLTSSHLICPYVVFVYVTSRHVTHKMTRTSYVKSLPLLTMLIMVKPVNFIITATLYHLGEIRGQSL